MEFCNCSFPQFPRDNLALQSARIYIYGSRCGYSRFSGTTWPKIENNIKRKKSNLPIALIENQTCVAPRANSHTTERRHYCHEDVAI